MNDELPPLPVTNYVDEDGLWCERFGPYDADQMRAYAAAAVAAERKWRPIETAPRGSGEDGPNMVTHPDYVAPPELLLKHADGIAVGYYEWYYHPGYGRGASPYEPVWRSMPDYSGLHKVTHWMPLPKPPSI